jgi:hypothetical protein
MSSSERMQSKSTQKSQGRSVGGVFEDLMTNKEVEELNDELLKQIEENQRFSPICDLCKTLSAACKKAPL